ncbi:MAG: PD-(D/E)XK nuclease family protein, partial [Planctomycetes bacterium]|nr:PD-(D/E)XK nuclease family protein [Planctomycetota bacterium]
MMIALHQLGDGRSLQTHSRMQTTKTCRRKAYFRYEIGWRPKRKPHYFRMGGAIHEGIFLRRKGASIQDAINQASEPYDSYPTWCSTDELTFDWLVEREKVRRLLAGYFWRWADDEIEVISAEEMFILPIINPATGKPSRNFQVGGKWDGIVKLPDGRLAIDEMKTPGEDISPGADFWRRLLIDQQISLYMLAAREKGFDVQTVLYEAIRKPTIKPKKLSKADLASLVSTCKYFGESIEVDPTNLPDRETPAMYGARLAH